MSYRNQHKHYCAQADCNNVIATCSAPQDYDGSPNTCTDEEHYHYVLCEDCEYEREQERIAEELAERIDSMCPGWRRYVR